jgi:hypothetical protein
MPYALVTSTHTLTRSGSASAMDVFGSTLPPALGFVIHSHCDVFFLRQAQKRTVATPTIPARINHAG